MTISLFDLGEGAAKVEILDPNGNPVGGTGPTGVAGIPAAGFDWETDCSNPPAALPTCSATGVSSLDPSPTSSSYKPYPRVTSQYIYNDRSMVITIALPGNYTASYGANQWWKIRYTTGTGTVTDRTTWSVNISGSPVHLVN
jgi:hypothetical protein